MVYDEPNINNFFPEIDHDALAKYMEQHANTEQTTPNNQPFLSICGAHGQNPEPKVVKHQLPVIQDEFSHIPNSNVTDVLNNPVFKSQSPVTETVTLNLEDTTNLQTGTYLPADDIRKQLENLPDDQKEKIKNIITQTGDWKSATDLAIKLMTNSPTGTSAITKFNQDKTLLNINQGPAFEVNTITRGGKGTGQPTAKPSPQTQIATKIQEILDIMALSPNPELEYYLLHAKQLAEGQTLDYTTNQPFYWHYVGEVLEDIGKNAILITTNGYEQKVLLCYNQRVLFIVGNKLVRLTDPEHYSKTVWKYVHNCIDRHQFFWVYDKNLRLMSHAERKRHLIDFYKHNNYRNMWS